MDGVSQVVQGKIGLRACFIYFIFEKICLFILKDEAMERAGVRVRARKPASTCWFTLQAAVGLVRVGPSLPRGLQGPGPLGSPSIPFPGARQESGFAAERLGLERV